MGVIKSDDTLGTGTMTRRGSGTRSSCGSGVTALVFSGEPPLTLDPRQALLMAATALALASSSAFMT